jgi:tetratricopeptide (TPR) repeat protein
MGEARERNGDHEQAQKYLLRSLELVQRERAANVAMLTLRVLTALGRVALRMQQVDRAERFFDQALAMAESLGEAQWAAKLLGNIGGVYHARQEYYIATEFVERALALSKDCGDQIGAARHSNNLGTLHLLAGNRHEAKSQFSRAYELAQNVGWREGMAVASAGHAQSRG